MGNRPDPDCPCCAGTGWVCENHLSTPWGKGSGECDCGAGKNCMCNPDGHVDWQEVYASIGETP